MGNASLLKPFSPDAIDEPAGNEAFRRGVAAYQQGEYDRAIADFTAAVRLDPGDAQAYAYRADAWRLVCEYDRSAEDYSRALRLDPANPRFHINRAAVHQLRNDHR